MKHEANTIKMDAYASEVCQNKSYRQLEIGGLSIWDPSKWQFNYTVLHSSYYEGSYPIMQACNKQFVAANHNKKSLIIYL